MTELSSRMARKETSWSLEDYELSQGQVQSTHLRTVTKLLVVGAWCSQTLDPRRGPNT